MSYVGKKCIIRGKDSGVFFGEIVEQDGERVKFKNFRKIHYWDGATAVEGLASYGTTKPDDCRFTLVVAEGEMYDACQVLPCTEKAIEVLEGVKVWTLT